MRILHHLNPGFGQFRWVVLLLAVAVILPTVCLLWFMNEVVKNERIVVRQRLTTFYRNRLAEAYAKVNRQWADSCRQLERRPSLHPYRQFVSLTGQGGYQGFLAYDDAGRCLYPVVSTDPGTLARPSEDFRTVWEMEFINHQYERAAELYEEQARISDDHGRLAAYIGKSRCLAKLGRLDQAIAECRLRAAFSPIAETGDSRSLALIARARLLLLGWMQNKATPNAKDRTGGFRPDPSYASLYEETFRKLLAMLYSANGAGFALPADENLFLARKVLEIGQATGLLDKNADLLRGTSLPTLMEVEERSIRCAEQFQSVDLFREWQDDTLQPLALGESVLYGVIHRTTRGSCIALLGRDNIMAAVAEYVGTFEDANVDFRILEEGGRFVAGIETTSREPCAAGPLGRYFPGWTVQLFFKGGDVFERAASEHVAVYTWTGVLFILLILVSGAVAAQSIGRQVQLNKLKNDFIATVTHELKTPLASMRVLVDTLLEGNYRNPNQVTEYLQLISRENERLSRLIDNFLTFSRMERNKQAFQMCPVSPVSIARTAAEAVKTKLGRGHCCFETEIPDELPTIRADHDAMVTVLVNLLDNAYKYSSEDKCIRLSAGAADGAVCFTVRDNGLGIPRRALKRIFRRFYQVDRSLSRRTEGCGLGLSIAKFIVDAHQGTIAVESKPGQGSTFTVRIPVAP
ncbi:MAG: HAMP domain-containing histidine kinase [Planctomycetes bacterium]|jgi:nitrogen-specific signal transduction histidine kinase/tetratricopeptide (TPR) repeat protein|nr:HAMP domain-containing histidine kinase [Planctomycetota bacterium]